MSNLQARLARIEARSAGARAAVWPGWPRNDADMADFLQNPADLARWPGMQSFFAVLFRRPGPAQ